MLSFRDILESMIGSISSVLENLWPSSLLRFLLFAPSGTPIISFVIALHVPFSVFFLCVL